VKDNNLERFERQWQILIVMFEQSEAYHSQKETNAYVGVTLQFALMAGVLSFSPWPPSWVPSVSLSPQTLLAIGFFALWLLFHLATAHK
jgi:hypothetical protein